MKKNINNSYQLYCSLECPRVINSDFYDFSQKSISFLEENCLSIFGEIIVKLENFVFNFHNFQFLVFLGSYLEEKRSKGKILYVLVNFYLSDLNKNLISLISQKKVCWELNTNLDDLYSKSDKVDLYYDLKNAADFCNKGIRFSYDIEKYTFLEAFKAAYNIGYGYPISLQDEYSLNISQYSNFLDELKKKISNLDIGFAESFFKGECFLRNVIKTLFSESSEVLRNRGESFNPCIKQNGDIQFNSFTCGEDFKIGFVNEYFDILKINKLQEIKKDNVILCPKCNSNKCCPRIISCEKNNKSLIKIIENCKDFVSEVNQINPDVALYLKNKNF